MTDESSNRPVVVRQCPDTALNNLFLSGLQSLHDENASLAAAFQPPHQYPRRFYNTVNQSLAYWVFETTLVYTLFKAWLPSERVRWEESYPGNRQNKADLVVFDDEEGHQAKWVFEAKWWPNSSTKTLKAIRGDLEKLLNWKSTGGRALLAFWYSPQGRREKDLREVDSFCSDRIRGIQPRCVFAGEFPIHTKWANRTWNFTMAAVQLPQERMTLQAEKLSACLPVRM